MVNKNYRIGYNFENRVRKYFQVRDYLVIRSGKSSFPDLVAIKPRSYVLSGGNADVLLIECKVNGYLSKEEIRKANEFIAQGFNFKVAFRKGKKLMFKEYIGGIIK